MIVNIITGTASSILTLIIVFLYNRIVKPANAEKKVTNTTASEKYFLFARYLAIFTIMVLFVIFVSLNKGFVLLIGFCFSILVIMFIYDYAIHLMNFISSKLDIDEKKKKESSIKQLVSEIPDANLKRKLGYLLDIKE
jgi:hypothetical protein